MTNKKILACLLAVNFSVLGLSETSPLVNISYAEEEVKEDTKEAKEDSKEEKKENTTEENKDSKEENKKDSKEEEKSDKKEDTKEDLEKEDKETKTEENVENTQNLAVAYYAAENLDDLVYGGEVSLYSLDDELEVSEAPRPRMARAARSATSDLETQKNQLQKAIDDSVNVKSTEVYNSLVTQKLRDAYSEAVANAKGILANNSGDYEKLRAATVAINSAKKSLATYASLKIEVINLEESLEDNEIKSEAASILINQFPDLVKSVEDDLINIINESEASAANSRALIEKANSYLAMFQ
ncbi:hypothetical protein [Anaerococcus vaginimassiliensis]|uniref:hypothetical protein n=1 Tax=Anaerococcus vaginimassiliensis TaxID=2042308 RepID=UPI0010327691|nr:hypothetical protein [Anaerococcus vaginimassiliensis]